MFDGEECGNSEDWKDAPDFNSESPVLGTWEKIPELGDYEIIRGSYLDKAFDLEEGTGTFLLSILVGDVLINDVKPISGLELAAIRLGVAMDYIKPTAI